MTLGRHSEMVDLLQGQPSPGEGVPEGQSISFLDERMCQEARLRNPDLGAFTQFLDQSDSPAREGALGGFSVAVKANIAVHGALNHCGSRILEHYRSPFDATAVSRLKAAGGHIQGLTAMDEFGMGSTCENTSLSETRNPWCPDRVAGGSSGGSAAAVAAGMSWCALGSDTGGSVRLPAAYCGVVGFKPTWGLVSRYGLVPFASSLDTIGILARGVRDAHLLLQIIAGFDACDSTSLKNGHEALNWQARTDLQGVKVGFLEDLDPNDLLDDGHAHHFSLLKTMEDLGATMVPHSVAFLREGVAAYGVLSCAEAASNLHRYDGSLFGCRLPGETYGRSLEETRSRFLGPEVQRRLLMGAHVLSSGFYDRYYLRAVASRRSMAQALQSLFSTCDVLALPTVASGAVRRGRWDHDPVGLFENDIFNIPASLCGTPAVSLPTGLNCGGLPLALQLMGPALSEGRLLAMARVLEKTLGFREYKEGPWHRPG